MENLELGDQLGNRPSVQILVVVAITQVDTFIWVHREGLLFWCAFTKLEDRSGEGFHVNSIYT